MGLKLRGPLRCGTCGKPRGITHTCVTRATSRRRKRRTKVHSPVTWECSGCGKARGLQHTCHVRTDFKKRRRRQATEARRAKRRAIRRRQAERRRRAAAERRARARERKRAAGARPRPARPRGESHEPGTCGDRDCPKYGCKAYFQGMEDCPFPHDGGG